MKCYLDFDGHDFDQPVVLSPAPATRKLWQSLLAVALEDMATLVAPTRVYVCEGQPDAPTASKRSFDASVLGRIFENDFATVDFVSAGGVKELPPVTRSITTLLPGTEVYRVIDRDGRTDEAVSDLKSEDHTLRVLSVRDLENYLLSDEVLSLGSKRWAEDPVQAESLLLSKKVDLLNCARYPDDVKEIAGSLFALAKQLWRLSQPGQDRHEFLRDICAPLIVQGTETYESLRQDLGL
jgi:hypothetical protein